MLKILHEKNEPAELSRATKTKEESNSATYLNRRPTSATEFARQAITSSASESNGGKPPPPTPPPRPTLKVPVSV